MRKMINLKTNISMNSRFLENDFFGKYSRNAKGIITSWANNAYGIIRRTDNWNIRFIEYNPENNKPLIDTSSKEQIMKCHIVAKGIVTSWFENTGWIEFSLLENKYYAHMNKCMEKIRHENSMNFIINSSDSELLLRHLKEELSDIEVSQKILPYLSDRDRNIIKKMVKGYIDYIVNKIDINAIYLSKQELVTLFYLSNHPNENVFCPYFMDSFAFENSCESFGTDIVLKMKGNDKDGVFYTAQIQDKGLGIVNSILDGSYYETPRSVMHTSREKHIRNTNCSPKDGLYLPSKLDIMIVREILKKAVEKGLCIVNSNGLTWYGVGDLGQKSQLAYMWGKMFNFRKLDTGGYEGDEIPFGDIELFCHTTGLRQLLYRVYDAAKEQAWRKIIDELFI